jgi:glycosyltransferase involved in cell wall biosynthesis
MANLTILFATHNGAKTLPRMLEALEHLELPGNRVKIVAVDNASTDGSADLIKARSRKLRITLLSEARRGKNIALNKGLSEIEGDLVVLTDDDIVPRRDWLISIRRIAEEQPSYDIFGGAIYPLWEQIPEEWVLRNVPKAWFGWTEFSEGPVSPLCIWGGNMAVRSQVFSEHRFSEEIGPDGTLNYAAGSEIEFSSRAAKTGHMCWHSRHAAVGHIIRAYQLRPEWLLQRAYKHARGLRRISKYNNVEDRGVPGYVIRQLLKATFYLTRASLFGTFEDEFKAKLCLRTLQGDLAERRPALSQSYWQNIISPNHLSGILSGARKRPAKHNPCSPVC